MMNKVTLLVALAATFLAGPAQGAGCDTRPTLKLYAGYSSKGLAYLAPDVKVLQSLLNSKISAGLTVDGLFGAKTDTSVRSYQSKNALTVDGIVGPNTWGKLCGTAPTCSIAANPYPSVPRGTAGWNPIMKYVVDKVNACFPSKFSCSTYLSPDSSSDHPGNAADCFPGKAGVCVTGGQDLIDGNALAAWAVKNMFTLKIDYVIWQNNIYSRTHPYWRSQGKTGCTYAHHDHVHISVI